MKIHELIQKRNEISAKMRELHSKAETEERGFSSDEKNEWEAMKTDLRSYDERIQLAQDAGNLEDVLEPRTQLPGQNIESNENVEERSRDEQYDDAFDVYLRRGVADATAEQRALLQNHYVEMRAQGTASGAVGGYTVPEGFGGRIIERMLQFGGVEQLATVLTTNSGNTIPFPTNDDTGNIGELLAENTATSEQDTVFGQALLEAYMYSSKMIRVPFQLLQDNEVNLEDYLVNILGKRLGRIQAAQFATGTGTGQPNGILTATTGITAAAAAAISFKDLNALVHGVDPSYRLNGMGAFAFNDNTLGLLEDLDDVDGRPIWRPSLSESAPATISGYRYVIDQGYNDVATGQRVATFGDHSAFMIRRVNGVQMMRLAERYAEFFQVAFLGFNRADSELLDTAAVKHLIMA